MTVGNGGDTTEADDANTVPTASPPHEPETGDAAPHDGAVPALTGDAAARESARIRQEEAQLRKDRADILAREKQMASKASGSGKKGRGKEPGDTGVIVVPAQRTSRVSKLTRNEDSSRVVRPLTASTRGELRGGPLLGPREDEDAVDLDAMQAAKDAEMVTSLQSGKHKMRADAEAPGKLAK
ncbi:hypothetical protein K438DRAFT_1983093 [Mycena galopus ATCC 62051]|nr:hypothetical protein K438DRAFT_1983090 [Mycena galopus ATCC 62051]KAF8169707.1 hypothetical protein K438DRAFT_1983093 [Mycena galopus ATCC 62051]